jgi:predicted house-cleaning noncanonical NTP pyrophosphatase (MazG superfamily)
MPDNNNISPTEALENEEALKKIIRDTIADICEKKNVHYPSICLIASRSAKGKSKIVEQVMEIMTSEESSLNLEQALTQVNGTLED